MCECTCGVCVCVCVCVCACVRVCVAVWRCGNVYVNGAYLYLRKFSIFHVSSIKFLELRTCAYPFHYLHHTTRSQVCALGCIFAATPHAFDTGGPTRVTATTTSTATTSTEIAQTPELGWTARSENYVDVTKGSEDHEETRC